ncbi:uncharacterized protein LOC125214843 isoform X2 [Salvia hispanica]|uniref:uncharacterized protein LOC125214843 isoform X2 n=1 Tax=Salvia hispanica TaxID=49212 RepID=UPI0020092EEC|nr:uncharacterized protein LOC125214843 isoform X2 [Salvia hispanica]
MESNKDEAIRAKSIAESMIEQMDYLGAKKLALKAQSLYPELSGITQLLSTLDVYLSGEKIDGEVDWYRVLCVNPSDDHDTIKKQFRKLALKLHPDKNSSVGADGAFQLISEAWNLLSDEEKRVAYNQRRGYGGVQKTVLTHTGGPSAPSGAWNSAQTRPSQQDVPSASPRKSKKKVPGHTGGSSAAAHTAGPSSSTSTRQSRSKITKKARTQRSDAFWTVCRGCNVHFEYLKVYGNLTLLCRNCDKPFTALEIATPVFSKSAQPIPWVRREQACDPNGNAAAAAEAGQTGPSSFVYTNYQHGPFPETAYTGQNAFDLNRNAAAAQNPGAEMLQLLKTQEQAKPVLVLSCIRTISMDLSLKRLILVKMLLISTEMLQLLKTQEQVRPVPVLSRIQTISTDPLLKWLIPVKMLLISTEILQLLKTQEQAKPLLVLSSIQTISKDFSLLPVLAPILSCIQTISRDQRRIHVGAWGGLGASNLDVEGSKPSRNICCFGKSFVH